MLEDGAGGVSDGSGICGGSDKRLPQLGQKRPVDATGEPHCGQDRSEDI